MNGFSREEWLKVYERDFFFLSGCKLLLDGQETLVCNFRNGQLECLLMHCRRDVNHNMNKHYLHIKSNKFLSFAEDVAVDVVSVFII